MADVSLSTSVLQPGRNWLIVLLLGAGHKEWTEFISELLPNHLSPNFSKSIWGTSSSTQSMEPWMSPLPWLILSKSFKKPCILLPTKVMPIQAAPLIYSWQEDCADIGCFQCHGDDEDYFSYHELTWSGWFGIVFDGFEVCWGEKGGGGCWCLHFPMWLHLFMVVMHDRLPLSFKTRESVTPSICGQICKLIMTLVLTVWILSCLKSRSS
jgi:hypothetical protein